MRAALVIAGIAIAPATARADVGVVVIGATRAPAGDGEVARALAAAIGDGARTDVVATARAALANGAVPAEALAGFPRVRELVDEGWRAYLQVQTEFALSRLGEARRQAEALLPLDGGLELYADAALRLGAALDNAGRHGDADDVLRLAVALDPGRAITADEFSPDVIAAVARATAAQRLSRVVAIDAGETHATASLDGGEPFALPSAFAIDVGQHALVVRAPGRLARGLTIDVDAGDGTQAVELSLDPDPAAALGDGPASGQDERAAAASVDAVMTYAETDAVVLASSVWRGGRPALLAQWCDGAPASCTAVVEIGYDDGALAAAAKDAIDELARARGGRRYGATLPGDSRLSRAERPVVVTPHRCRWCKPALYAGGGVAVVLGTIAVIAIASGGSGGTVVTVDPSDF